MYAQDVSVFAEQSQLFRLGPSIEALGPTLMGDKVGLYTGELEFVQTDVSLPGNNALAVSVGRRYEASATMVGYTSRGLFGDWDLEIPHLHGVFAAAPAVYQGWNVEIQGSPASVSTARCSAFGPPVYAFPINSRDSWDPDEGTAGRRSSWDPAEFWGGNFLYVPGAGDQKLLKRDAAFTSRPSDGNSYGVVTKSNWQFRCLTTGLRVNGTAAAGEGFIALAPDGTQYRFDWMVSRVAPPLKTAAGGLSRNEVWILPTLVTDRFGNTVTYSYDVSDPWKLLSIVASDGRSLSLAYHSGTHRVASVTDGSRTWSYAYTSTEPARLNSTSLPDGSAWQFLMAEQRSKPVTSDKFSCAPNGTVDANPGVSTIAHPSGAVGTFGMSWVAHGHANVLGRTVSACPAPGQDITPMFAARSLTSKSISGPGLTPATWSYDWGPPNGSWFCSSGCPNTKTLTVTDPRAFKTRYIFSNLFKATEGQLLRIDEGWTDAGALRATTFAYRAYGAGPYASTVGWSGRFDRSDQMDNSFLPLAQRTITQQGITFSWQANTFDTLARPTSVTRSGTAARTETTAYADNTAKWVLGQIASVTEASTGGVMVSNTYDASTASLLSTSAFGQLQQSFSYYADGTLYKRFDPAGRATTFSNYKRGIAQTVSYPDSTAASAVVNNIGTIASVTNEAGTTWSFGYDAMGRLASKTPPSGDPVAYNATTISSHAVPVAEYDLEANHWRQIITTGNAVTVHYFDALWRKRMTLSYDAADRNATQRMQRFDYDVDGRTSFISYPARAIGSITPSITGAATVYDALGRIVQTVRSSDLGNLTTTTQYLSGFQKRVTNPRGHATTTSYQVFDEPSETAVVSVTAPEDANVAITRDVFGKPASTTRSGGWGGGTVSATRRYFYDDAQRLCKTIEPETGSTVQAYDVANNVAWRATGLGLTSLSCDRASVPDARKASHGYDTRNRLTSTSYGDGSEAVQRSYTPDGLPLTVTSGSNSWTYSYNRRRLLTQETYAFGSTADRIAWGYDANGSLSQLAYPNDGWMFYAPNALGEPTQIGSYATGITYHPNGAVAGYTLGNGIAYSLTQNTQGLPLVGRYAGVLQDRYSYDANDNVTAIADELQSVASRTMGYDGLDRLTTATAPGLWGNASYGYDPLDNLRTSVVGSRSTTHGYDANNRLSLLNTNGTLTGFAYDANGNITGRGTQGYYFDLANRMKLANGVASYAYDGHGRRTTVSASNGLYRTPIYSKTGQLLYGYSRQGTTSSLTRYVYLGNKLIAETDTSAGTTYAHADALGSPWARTNSAGQVISRTRYEPYGATAAGTNPGANGFTGIGFTGHVNDADTGLVYMQQRYYDPIAGRFLSVDPVTTDASTGSDFNRYVYGNNSPYRYTDPDGRESVGEFIDRNAFDAAKAGEGLKTYGWAFAGTAWKAFGAEGVSQIADKGLSGASTGDKVGAGFELAGAALGPLGKLGGTARGLGPIAGGGAKLENLTAAEIARIQNAANRTGTEISVVGSRANGTARANSDWDYVIPHETSRSTRHSLSSSVPEGPRGLGEPRNQDFFREALDPNRPYITFTPTPR